MTKNVAVVGAGIVGVCTAMALQEAGYVVTLLDPAPIGSQTSYGNTGVLVENPWLVVNNPGLWKNLVEIARNRDPRVRVDWRFVFSRLPLFAAFLGRTSTRHADAVAHSLKNLLVVSQRQHKRWITAAGADELLRQTGWLKVFRTEDSFGAFERELGLIRATGTAHRILSGAEVADLEPALTPRFARGLLLCDACSLSSPLDLTQRYFKLFEQRGGALAKVRVCGLTFAPGQGWTVCSHDGGSLKFDLVVLAAGPWSGEIAAKLGCHVPMFWERGYHRHLEPGQGPGLRRPVHVVDEGFVMTPQSQGTRVTSGVEIAHRDSPPDFGQINRAVASAQALAALGRPVEDVPWMGSRPSIVDGLPIIGQAPLHEGLWFNFGHHHIGLSLAAGSALLLAALLQGTPPPVDPSPFNPDRFQWGARRSGHQYYAGPAAIPGVNLP